MEKINWFSKHFNEITVEEYHDLLHLRTAVFVLEQDCPYQEVDDKDKVATHIFGVNDNGETIAVARVLPENVSYAEISIGRVALKKSARGKGLAEELMQECFNAIHKLWGNKPIRISAQEYLLNFYSKLGFIQVGKMYLEDDIPHIEMLKEVKP